VGLDQDGLVTTLLGAGADLIEENRLANSP
jgi:hypothetical protein